MPLLPKLQRDSMSAANGETAASSGGPGGWQTAQRRAGICGLCACCINHARSDIIWCALAQFDCCASQALDGAAALITGPSPAM